MKIRSYIDFITESILYASNDFKKVLSNTDDPTAKELLSLINKDINTNYNILRTTDRNDSVLFISDTQATYKLKSTDPSTLLLGRSGNNTSINRVVRSVLNDNGIKKTDREMEIFVNKFKAAYDKLNANSDLVRVVDGEDIRFWYNEVRYCKETSDGKGTLGKSCMRYQDASVYLDIYCKNPEICKLVIQVDEEGMLRSRALLWKTSEGMYLDRIYYTQDSDQNLITDWVKLEYGINIMTYSDLKVGKRFNVKLRDDVEYNLFPYMDSIPYYFTPTKTLYNYPYEIKKGLLLLQQTDGYGIRQDLVYSEYDDTEYDADEVVFSDYLNSYIHKSDSVWSRTLNSYLHTSTALYSSIVDDYLDSSDVHVVYKNSDKSTFDIYPVNSEEEYYGRDYNMDELTGNFYINSLLVKHKDEYYLKDISIFVYRVLPEDLEKYKSIYNTENLLCTELDKKIFNFKTSDDYDILDRKSFYLKNYYKIILDDFIKMLNGLKVDKSLIIQKIDEVMKADQMLNSGSAISHKKIYRVNNRIKPEFGSIDNMMRWYRDFISNDLDNYYEEIMNNNRYISWNLIDHELVKKLCLNPIYNNKYLPFDYVRTLTDKPTYTKDIVDYTIKYILNKLDDSKSNLVLNYFSILNL